MVDVAKILSDLQEPIVRCESMKALAEALDRGKTWVSAEDVPREDVLKFLRPREHDSYRFGIWVGNEFIRWYENIGKEEMIMHIKGCNRFLVTVDLTGSELLGSMMWVSEYNKNAGDMK